MRRDFVHLHVHSQYSLLCGAIRLEALAKQVALGGGQAVALTDQNNMFGAIHFARACQGAGIKPIFGCSLAVSRGSRTDGAAADMGQLVLLAKNAEGYRALSYLVSMAHWEGPAGRPRIDRELLAAHSKDLIVLTGGRRGIVAESLEAGGEAAARLAIESLVACVPAGQLYLEMTDSRLPAASRRNDLVEHLGHVLSLPLVLTCDAHFLTADDAEAHEVLACIGAQRSLAEFRQRDSHDDGAYVRSADEMWAAYGDRLPEALHNTVLIAESCNVELDLSQTFLPNYEVPSGKSREAYLAEVAERGLAQRLVEAHYATDRDTYEQRLAFELNVINKMGFAGYFLVVWDFIRFAKEEGIPVGPGRGSGAGSLVAYALRITDLDPLPYDLLFERFLNPERVSMPDFDIDFCQDRRGEVIDYVARKYGRHNVGQIVTYSLLSAKSVIKDVGRVLELPFAEVNELTKLIPSLVAGKKVSIDQALSIEPKLRDIQTERPVYAEVITIARKLEGLCRQTGMHAAGIVIGDRPLWDYVPICRGKDGELVTQFAKDEVELAGLVKFDFLGLKTLTVIARAEALIRARKGAGKQGPYSQFDVARVPLDDAGVYRLIGRGDTDGVFQLESSGFKELLKRLVPDRFEDIVAAVALYRPGPLDAGMVDDYIGRKHGRKKVTYPHPVCRQILSPTYGVIVYQEQVMRIAVSLCGFSMGQADVLRKAMGKKKAEVMAEMREQFVSGAERKSDMPKAAADELFTQIEKFAGYAFNKSHSAAYAVISYQTAYLKTYHPAEFMAALLSTEMRDQDNVVRYITSAKETLLTVHPPCVNRSERDFAVVDEAAARGGRAIVFGLGAVKGIGDSAIDAILAGRTQAEGNRPADPQPKQSVAFADLYAFCGRVDLKRVTKKALEALIKSGAMDSFGTPRARLFAELDAAYEHGQRESRDRLVGQASLFQALAPASVKAPSGASLAWRAEAFCEWPEKERLAHEKAALGFYITGHPLAAYAQDLARLTTATTETIKSMGQGQSRSNAEVVVAGVVSAMRERPLKSGNGRMAFVTLEDRVGQVEVLVFSKAFAEGEAVLRSGEPVLCTGVPHIEGDDEGAKAAVKLRAKRFALLADVRRDATAKVALRLRVDEASEAMLEHIHGLCREHAGEVPLGIELYSPGRYVVELRLPKALAVCPSEAFLGALSTLAGYLEVRLHAAGRAQAAAANALPSGPVAGVDALAPAAPRLAAPAEQPLARSA